MRYHKHIFKSITLNVSSERVWESLRPDNGAAYILEITASEWCLEGDKWTRSGSTENGRKLKEVVESLDDNSMQYSYQMIEQDLWPVCDYKGEIRVQGQGTNQASIEWSLSYLVDPEHDLAAEILIGAAIQDTLDKLYKKLNVRSEDSRVIQMKAA